MADAVSCDGTRHVFIEWNRLQGNFHQVTFERTPAGGINQPANKARHESQKRADDPSPVKNRSFGPPAFESGCSGADVAGGQFHVAACQAVNAVPEDDDDSQRESMNEFSRIADG